MTRPPGRPADALHRRMARVLHVLIQHPTLGRTSAQLMAAAGLDPENASEVRKFRRDLKALRAAGWHIDTLHRGANEYAHVLRVIDPRIRTSFTVEQRAQLLRAAERAGLAQLYDDLDESAPSDLPGDPGLAELGVAQHAVRHRCRVLFSYGGRPRRVHPYDVFLSGDAWFLRGREEGTEQEYKTFRLARAEDLQADLPGTAEPPHDLPPPNRDPMRLAVVEPLEMVVAAAEDDLPDVEAALGGNGFQRLPGRTADGEVQLAVVVTNPPAALGRLFELDTRARLVGPEAVRDQARALLLAAAGRR
jgi:predicted DNA-binding transcriptional regulator YafY